MKLLEKLAFFALLASLPIQLGKHFWPHFSFVQGIRVDYLSPTLYLSDIVFLVLFSLSAVRLRKSIFAFLKNRVTLFLLVILTVSTVLAENKIAGLYGIIKLFELIYIAFYVSKTFKKEHVLPSLFILVSGGLCEVVIAFFQFISQGSIGGPFYYLGERTFNSATLGIALFNFDGQQILRPYGTFPHPNVLAFYLLTVFTLLLSVLSLKKKLPLILQTFALFILSVGIIMTVSRTAIVLYFLVVALWVLYVKGISKVTRVRIFAVCALAMVSFVVILFDRFAGSVHQDFKYRLELYSIGLSIFLKNPVLGVGLNNFFYHEIFFQKTVSPTLLQPVHNIFFHWIVQTGLVGSALLMVLIVRVFRKVSSRLDFVLLICIIFVGLFDHYLITLQQGQLMTAFLIGFIFSKAKE